MKITLHNGREFRIDESDLDLVNSYKWNVHIKKSGYKYVYRFEFLNGSYKMRHFHRELLNCPDKMFVDHQNGDTLDNRRSNLRICTNRQNQWNQKRVRGVVPFKGVTFEFGKYRSRIRVNGKKINLGMFKSAQEAAEAYANASRLYFKEYSFLCDSTAVTTNLERRTVKDSLTVATSNKLQTFPTK